jgi:acetate---CoA ligase (ADP-forming)
VATPIKTIIGPGHDCGTGRAKPGLRLCGPNCMGFLHPGAPLYVAGYPTPTDLAAGGVTLITQSGSVFGAMSHGDRRLRFNLLVSSGAEWTTTAADYMHWALAQDSTRVIAVFLETVRDPDSFREALRLAAERETPVVVLKVGRTPESAAMAITHSGAIAGSDAAFSALCDHFGVTRVDTMDEMAAAVLAFGQGRRAGSGGLSTMHDSGGQREMLVDLASTLGLPFARIGAATRERLRSLLDPGLEPENPLDAWGTGREFSNVFEGCLEALSDDPDTALSIWFQDLRDTSYMSDGCERAALAVAARTRKPLLFATNYSLGRYRERALRLTAAGVPVLDGTLEALQAARHLMAWRDFHERAEEPPPPAPPAEVVAHWRRRLRDSGTPDEPEALAMLESFGIPVAPWRLVEAREDLGQAIALLGLPLVLKSAAPGLHHKTEVGGVVLNLRNEREVLDGYDGIAAALGPRVIAARMIGGGVELGLGALVDDQFGPYVMVAAGGTMIEFHADRSFALAPVTPDGARRVLDRLRVRRLLDGWRGAPPCDLDAIADTLSRLSTLLVALGEEIESIDINPLICTAGGCFAADALIAVREPGRQEFP